MNDGRIEQDGAPAELLDRPASAFVMNFLGRVNAFHGRVESGRAVLGPIVIDYPGHTSPMPHAATGYARPHELALSRAEDDNGLWARVTAVNATGAVVKIELSDDEERLLQVETARDTYQALAPNIGERFYVRPQTLRVFLTPD
jgi:sulfate transport system ATP-binding protein